MRQLVEFERFGWILLRGKKIEKSFEVVFFHFHFPLKGSLGKTQQFLSPNKWKILTELEMHLLNRCKRR